MRTWRYGILFISLVVLTTACSGWYHKGPSTSVEGLWTINMQGSAQDGHGTNSCDFHAAQLHEFDVTQDSDTTFSGPQDGGGIVNGQINVDLVSFQILIITADGCNDLTDLSGTLAGNAITGTYSGGDCTGGEYCTWEGSFTVDIQQD